MKLYFKNTGKENNIFFFFFQEKFQYSTSFLLPGDLSFFFFPPHQFAAHIFKMSKD